MWSVLTGPYLVLTVEPSTSGSRSRCTPSRETSAPHATRERWQTLSISSMKTMPFCSAGVDRLRADLLLVDQLAGLLLDQQRARGLDRELALLASCWPARFWNMPRSCWLISSMPGGAMMSMPTLPAMSSSISRSSSLPSRSMLAELRRACSASSADVGGVVFAPDEAARRRARGSSASRMRSSARSSACVRTLGLGLVAHLLDRGIGQVADDGLDVLADVADLGELGRLDLDEGRVGQRAPGAARSRSCRRRWGRSSGCSSASPRCAAPGRSCMRRQRLRSAIATARLAASWPTMCWSSSATICLGVR